MRGKTLSEKYSIRKESRSFFCSPLSTGTIDRPCKFSGTRAPPSSSNVGATRDLGIGEQVLVPLGRNELGGAGVRDAAVGALLEVGMHGLVRQIQDERSIVGPAKELQGALVEDVRRVTANLLDLAVDIQ